MSLTVRLAAAMEGLVNRPAKQRGITKSEPLPKPCDGSRMRTKGKSLGIPMMLFPFSLGCTHGGPPTLSEQTGQRFRKLLRCQA